MCEDHLVMNATTWEFLPQINPGIATNRDGRLLVTDGKETLILPSPATFIWEDAQARKTVTKIWRNIVS